MSETEIEYFKPAGTMALSHSRLSDFNQCPRKFWHKYIGKTPNFLIDDKNKSVHLVRGGNVHKALENFVIDLKDGKTPKVSSLSEVEQTKPLIQKYISMFGLHNVYPESQISVNKDWKQVDWFSKASYYRAIFDLIALNSETVLIVDYKTGKFKEYNPGGPGQLELSAAIALSLYDVPKVMTMYAYVDHKQVITKDFDRSKKNELTDHFDAELIKVNEEKNFDPKRNEFCSWCEATKAQCKFSRKL